MNVDDDSKIRWIRGLRRRRLRRPTLFPQTWKKAYFLASGRSWEFLSFVFYTPINKYFCIRRLASARHVSPVVLWTLTRRWVDAPNERTSFRSHDTESLVLWIDVCRELGILPLRIKYSAEVFSGRSWPNICRQELFFSFFGFVWKVLKLFFEDLCS